MFYRKAALESFEILTEKHLKIEFSKIGLFIALDNSFSLFKSSIKMTYLTIFHLPQIIFCIILLFSLYYMKLIGKISQWSFHLKISFQFDCNKQAPKMIFYQKIRSSFSIL